MISSLAPSTLPGPRIAGYALVRELGEGAYGQVFEAEDVRTGTHVALKVFSRSTPGDGFVRELGIAIDLRHPNLVAAKDMGYLHDGRRYVAYELARGGSLRARLADGPLSLRFVRHVLIELARALEVLHAEHLVHRDVKPENILLTSGDAYPRVQLADYGTSDGTIRGDARGSVGSPAYMAPEQIGGACDVRADVYAFAVLAYELLAGRCPFDGDAVGVLRGHLHDAPDFSVVPAAVADALASALAKDPERRPPRVTLLARAIDLALAEEIERPRDAIAFDERSGWCAVAAGGRVSARGEGAPDGSIAVTPRAASAVGASTFARIATRDDDALTLGVGVDQLRFAKPLYGLPPVVATRSIAGDVVSVDGGAKPSLVTRSWDGTITAAAPLPVPLSDLVVTCAEDGEHLVGLDAQRSMVIAVHGRAVRGRASSVPLGARVHALAVERGRAALVTEHGRSFWVDVRPDGSVSLMPGAEAARWNVEGARS